MIANIVVAVSSSTFHNQCLRSDNKTEDHLLSGLGLLDLMYSLEPSAPKT